MQPKSNFVNLFNCLIMVVVALMLNSCGNDLENNTIDFRYLDGVWIEKQFQEDLSKTASLRTAISSKVEFPIVSISYIKRDMLIRHSAGMSGGIIDTLKYLGEKNKKFYFEVLPRNGDTITIDKIDSLNIITKSDTKRLSYYKISDAYANADNYLDLFINSVSLQGTYVDSSGYRIIFSEGKQMRTSTFIRKYQIMRDYSYINTDFAFFKEMAGDTIGFTYKKSGDTLFVGYLINDGYALRRSLDKDLVLLKAN